MEEFKFVKGQGLFCEDQKITDFDVRVRKIILIKEGNNTHREYELEATTLDGKILPMRRVSKITNLSFFDLWPEIVDAHLQNEQKRLLYFRLQISCQECEKVTIENYSENGLYVSATGKMLIAGDVLLRGKNSPEVKISISEEIKRMRWKTSLPAVFTTDKGWVQDYLNVSPGASEILFAAILLSAVKPFFIEAGYNPSVCVNLYGKTGSYKTSLIQAFLYTKSQSPFLASLVNDKRAMVLKKIKAAYGFPFILEDYHPGATGYDYRRQISIMDAAVRCIENTPRSAVVFITSEFLDGSESLQARTVQIEAQHVDLSILTKLQEEKCMPYIVYNYLLKLMEADIEEVKTNIRNQYEELNTKGKEGMRIDDSIVYLLITARLFEKYCLASEERGLSERLEVALRQQREIQRLHLNSISLSLDERIILKVYELIFGGNVYQPCGGTREYRFGEKELWCVDEMENIVGLTREAFKYGWSLCGIKGVSLHEVIGILANTNILKRDKDTYTVKRKNKRLYMIRRNVLEDQYYLINEDM